MPHAVLSSCLSTHDIIFNLHRAKFWIRVLRLLLPVTNALNLRVASRTASHDSIIHAARPLTSSIRVARGTERPSSQSYKPFMTIAELTPDTKPLWLRQAKCYGTLCKPSRKELAQRTPLIKIRRLLPVPRMKPCRLRCLHPRRFIVLFLSLPTDAPPGTDTRHHRDHGRGWTSNTSTIRLLQATVRSKNPGEDILRIYSGTGPQPK